MGVSQFCRPKKSQPRAELWPLLPFRRLRDGSPAGHDLANDLGAPTPSIFGHRQGSPPLVVPA
jgi:hypothetical protein